MRGRFTVYAVTFVSYASYYLSRKNFSVVKKALEAEGLAKPMLATIDTAYLAAYAVGQFVSGALCDRIGSRKLVSIGMLVSALATAAMGLGPIALLLVGAALVNGLAQSTGWPGNGRAMATWTPKEDRGKVMGLWSICLPVGGIAATALATRCLDAFGWRGAFYGPAIAVAAAALLVALLLRDAPASSDTTPGAPETPAVDADDVRAERRAMLRSVEVWSYGAAYLFVKMIRYCLLFWLPYFFKDAVGLDQVTAGYASIGLEVGGIVGTIGFGLASDRLPRVPRAAVAAVGLVLLAASIYAFAALAPKGAWSNAIAVGVVGVLLFGPDALLSGAASQDLGGKHNAGLAMGMVNGLGSIGGVLQGYVTVGLEARGGWKAVLLALVAFAVLGALVLGPALWKARRPAEA